VDHMVQGSLLARLPEILGCTHKGSRVHHIVQLTFGIRRNEPMRMDDIPPGNACHAPCPALLEDEADDLGEFIGFTGLLSTCLVVNQSK
jgi:hypothetical protein